MEYFALGKTNVPVRFRKAPATTQKYHLSIQPDGCVRLSIPPGGTMETARTFLLNNATWVLENIRQVSPALRIDQDWPEGIRVLHLGSWMPIHRSSDRLTLILGNSRFPVRDPGLGLRSNIQSALRSQAGILIPQRVRTLAAQHGFSHNRISIRNQRKRWGSCSSAGNLSLNWHLIQCPEWICDYVILHELHHLRRMDHSFRFWRALRRDFPAVRQAERWLRDHAFLLLS